MSKFNGKIMQQAWMLTSQVQKIMQVLNDNEGESRFIGGCIRNALVNREIIDIDIATTLKPDEVIEVLKNNKIKYVPTGLEHGTITAIIEGQPFEVTTLRKDVENFGRHAKVEFIDDWKLDAGRRDFTINAISANIEGDLFDPFGGIEDLRLGRVRFIGNAKTRIEEDVLRILRFFRFYAHFGRGEPDKESLKACINAAGEIEKLSFERIRNEILKLLESDNSAKVWKLMVKNNVTKSFLPAALEFKNLERLIKFEKKYDSQMFPLRRFATLLKIEPEEIKKLSNRMRFSKNQYKDLLRMIKPEVSISLTMKSEDIRKAVYHIGNDMLRNLLLLDAARSDENIDFFELYNEATVFRAPRFPIVGNDILKYGYEQGSKLGDILREIENYWIENNFQPNRTACLKRLEEIVG